jgi:hypothetical protein
MLHLYINIEDMLSSRTTVRHLTEKRANLSELLVYVHKYQQHTCLHTELKYNSRSYLNTIQDITYLCDNRQTQCFYLN